MAAGDYSPAHPFAFGSRALAKSTEDATGNAGPTLCGETERANAPGWWLQRGARVGVLDGCSVIGLGRLAALDSCCVMHCSDCGRLAHFCEGWRQHCAHCDLRPKSQSSDLSPLLDKVCVRPHSAFLLALLTGCSFGEDGFHLRRLCFLAICVEAFAGSSWGECRPLSKLRARSVQCCASVGVVMLAVPSPLRLVARCANVCGPASRCNCSDRMQRGALAYRCPYQAATVLLPFVISRNSGRAKSNQQAPRRPFLAPRPRTLSLLASASAHGSNRQSIELIH